MTHEKLKELREAFVNRHPSDTHFGMPLATMSALLDELDSYQLRERELSLLLTEATEYVAMMQTRFKAEEDRIEAARFRMRCLQAAERAGTECK